MKVALWGVWHVHARDYLRSALALAEVVGVYDANETWRKEFCEKNNLPEFDSPEALLQSEAEGVIVCTATSEHVEVMERIADAGKDIFTEKVLALSDEGCERIAAAVERNGVKFVISLPQKYNASRIAVQQVAASGELGKLNYMRFRNCHSGSVDNWLPAHFYNAEECGGGAMIDLGAHGMYLTDWICGQPDTYASTFTVSCDSEAMKQKNADGVEDNAVTVMGYANGCIVVAETGFVSKGYPVSLEVGGDKGYVRLEGSTIVKATADTEYKQVEVEIGENQPLPIEQFLTGNILPGCGMEEAKRLTHMMVMAYKNVAK